MPQAIIEELARTGLFQDVPESTLSLVAQQAEAMELKQGAVLLSPERENHCVYLLLSGALSLHFDSIDSPEIRELAPGVSVGEMSVIDDSPPSAYVVAKTPCRVLALNRELLRHLVDTNPVARNLLRLMNQWLKANTGRIVQDRERIGELTDQANIDSLTGLYNRRWLDNALPRLLEQAHRDGAPLTVLLIEVDNFKKYNDTWGFQNSDNALVALSDALKTTARPYDFSTRYGGVEFLVLLQNTDTDGGVEVAERIRNAVRKEAIAGVDGAALPGITVCIGLATGDAQSTPRSLIQVADDRLYHAKKEGSDRLCYSSLEFPQLFE